MIWGCDDSYQEVDLSADVSVQHPMYSKEAGPKLFIDAAHHNFHTASGRYKPLADLLQNDGFSVVENKNKLSDSTLAAMDILVIANADFNAEQVSFTPDEILALKDFVYNGGSLLLIADHIPFPAAIYELAQSFHIHFHNVFAEDNGTGKFTIRNAGLASDSLLSGIDHIRTFAGSAFQIDTPDYRPLLVMGNHWTIQTMGANGLSEKTSAEGLLQGALLEPGNGKVAVFGEVGMFTAQVFGGMKTKMGFHANGAEQNKQFILNVIRWLGTGK